MADLRARLGLDGSDYSRNIAKAKQENSTLHHSLNEIKGTIARVFAAEKIIEFGKYVVENAGHIKDLSEQFGITTDEVQRLQNAAADVGLTFDDMGTAILKLGSARKDAAQGNQELIATFAQFGITMADLQNPTQRNLDLLMKMGDAVKGLDLSAQQTQALKDLLGRAGGKLGAAIGGIGTDKNAPDIAPSDIEAADKADKAYNRAWRKLTGFTSRVFTEVMGEGELDWKRGFTGKGAVRSDEEMWADVNAKEGGALDVAKAKKARKEAKKKLFKPSLEQDNKWAEWEDEMWADPKHHDAGGKDAASNLVRLGNFAGVAGADPAVNVQRDSLRELKNITRNTSKIASASGASGDNNISM
jgi:hypothetical protein